jgi:hypothetical protein
VQYDQNNRVMLCFWVIKSNAIASWAYILRILCYIL